MFKLHAKIEVPQKSWGEPVRQATDTLLAAWPQAETRLYDGRQPVLTVDLRTMILPDALAAVQRLGMTLSPQGLTLIEVAARYDEASPEAGYYASGPAQTVARWLTEGATLDLRLGFNGPLAVHLRYLGAAEVAA